MELEESSKLHSFNDHSQIILEEDEEEINNCCSSKHIDVLMKEEIIKLNDSNRRCLDAEETLLQIINRDTSVSAVAAASAVIAPCC